MNSGQWEQRAIAMNGRFCVNGWPDDPMPNNIIGMDILRIEWVFTYSKKHHLIHYDIFRFINETVIRFCDQIMSVLSNVSAIAVANLTAYPGTLYALQRLGVRCARPTKLSFCLEDFDAIANTIPEQLEKCHAMALDSSSTITLRNLRRAIQWLNVRLENGAVKYLALHEDNECFSVLLTNLQEV